jgi:hypothetical protein
MSSNGGHPPSVMLNMTTAGCCADIGLLRPVKTRLAAGF